MRSDTRQKDSKTSFSSLTQHPFRKVFGFLNTISELPSDSVQQVKKQIEEIRKESKVSKRNSSEEMAQRQSDKPAVFVMPSGFDYESFSKSFQQKGAVVQEEYQEEETFTSMISGQGTGNREPKNMSEIFDFYNGFFFDKDGKSVPNGLNEKWNRSAYDKYVMGAKKMKESMHESGTGRKIMKDQTGNVLFSVIVGSETRAVRTNIEKAELTYPDFIACISIQAIRQQWHDKSGAEYPPAPLAANIAVEENDMEAYRADGYTIIGHGGIAAVANYFFRLKHNSAVTTKWGPKVGNICIIAMYMDDQTTGKLHGEDNTLRSIAQTCGASKDELLDDAELNGWVVSAVTTQARRTAADLREALRGAVKVKKPVSGPGPVPVRGVSSSRGGRGSSSRGR